MEATFDITNVSGQPSVLFDDQTYNFNYDAPHNLYWEELIETKKDRLNIDITLNTIYLEKRAKSNIKRDEDLNKIFIEEFLKYSHYLKGDLSFITSNILNLNHVISTIEYKHVQVELSPLNAIKYKFAINDNEFFIVTKPFENLSDLKDNEAVFSYFIDNECVLSHKKDINELAEGINQFIKS